MPSAARAMHLRVRVLLAQEVQREALEAVGGQCIDWERLIEGRYRALLDVSRGDKQLVNIGGEDGGDERHILVARPGESALPATHGLLLAVEHVRKLHLFADSGFEAQ